jgi:DNA-binding transcriptional ArsR family regulator
MVDAQKTHTIEETQPKVDWDLGTAYDLMMSLEVLHNPENFGLRASWAAGVRSRVPSDERSILEDSLHIIYVPLTWVHSLQSPKDGATALWSLSQVSPSERLPTLALSKEGPKESEQILREVWERRAWEDKDLENLKKSIKSKKGHSPKHLDIVLDWWSRPEEFGERYLKALQSYYQEFFAEEERRILPALKQSIEQAQELAEKAALPELIETLSQGVKLSIEPDMTEVIFAPSYWITPLILYNLVDRQRMIVMFGARPADASLVPGEMVPDAILRALKALADPTRLKILRYLSQEPLAPAQLARRLRLRPPTVIHHLEVLRLAGLVILNLEVPGERKYAARSEGLEDTFANLQGFLQSDLTKSI